MKSFAKHFILIFLVGQVFGANILYLHSVLSPSHHIWNSALAKGLVKAGHNVTFLSTDKPKGETKNLHYIVFEGSYENLNKDYDEHGIDFNIMDYVKENENKLKSARIIAEYGIMSCSSIMQAKSALDKILSYPDDFKFDLVVNDITCGSCLLPILHKFNYPPIVGVSAFLNPPYTHFSIGGHKYPAYIPHYLIDFKHPMSFYQRFYNFLLYFIEDL